MPRFFLDTSAHLERWTGDSATKKTVEDLLGDDTHATSSHAYREWKRIMEGAAIDIVNVLQDRSVTASDLFARLSQGRGREAGQRFRALVMFVGEDPNTVDIRVVRERARAFLIVDSEVYFTDRIDTVRDTARCELARCQPQRDADDSWSLKTTCRMKDADCDQVEDFERKREGYDGAAACLQSPGVRAHDQKMGELVAKVAEVARERRGRNCYGGYGDVSIVTDARKDETIIATDHVFAVLAPALGLSFNIFSPTPMP